MPSETKPLPLLAVTAVKLLQARIADQVNAVAKDILDAMALDPADGWRINMDTGIATREVPDISPAPSA